MTLLCPRCQRLTHQVEPATGEAYCPACHVSFLVGDGQLPLSETVNDPLRTGPFKPAEAATLSHLPEGTTEASGPTRPTVADYDILGELGRGGMGIVYRARQKGLDRLVALKMILAGGHAGPEELARFRSEAEAVASLQHPNIVQIYSVGETNGLPYFSLELLEGGSLKQKLAGTPQDAREAARFVETLARAVHAAHERGVVHRDLKPANILLTSDGIPKIADFGLAKRLDDDSGRTRTGQVLGTPSYMAPEQAEGHVHAIGPCTDVYALGTILYEALTGRPPFKGATLRDTLDQVCSHSPVPPTQLQPRIPRDLETVCLKCLHKEVPKRYASAAALADDLERYLDGRPVSARPVTAREKVWRWAKRRPALAGLLVMSTVTALMLTGLVVGLVYNSRLVHAHRAEELQRQRAEQALGKAEDYLYFNRIGLAERNWWGGNVGRARELLAECPESRRGWEWHYLDRLCHSEIHVLEGHGDEVLSVGFSPDGTRLASGSRDRTVRVWDAGTGKGLFDFQGHTEHIWSVAFSPDVRKLASASGNPKQLGEVIVWDLRSSAEALGAKPAPRILHLPGLTGESCRVVFSPDGERLVQGQTRSCLSAAGCE